MNKKLKNNYIFLREALRTATCSMLSEAAVEEGYYNESWLSYSKKINVDSDVYRYIRFQVEFYSDNKNYFLVKNDKIVFARNLRGKEAAKQIIYDFKHFPILYNSLIPAYQQDTVSLRKVIKNYPSMFKLYYEMAKRDFFTKLKI